MDEIYDTAHTHVQTLDGTRASRGEGEGLSDNTGVPGLISFRYHAKP